ANEEFERYQSKIKRKKEKLNSEDKIVIYTDGSHKDNKKGSYAGITENKIADKLARQGAAIKMNESKKLSPYNAFIKTNLLVIKKNNPELDHKDAFKLVASM
ncbi:9785_t:CDS:2, partial [Cetraspora pellucida]